MIKRQKCVRCGARTCGWMSRRLGYVGIQCDGCTLKIEGMLGRIRRDAYITKKAR